MSFKEKGFELLHIYLLTCCMNDNDEKKPTKKDNVCCEKPQVLLPAHSRKHTHKSVTEVISN